ncbi:MAG TPA: rRNA maturation RNase YbeY [Steroidobacteraceae bacterium]|jgi:probable rRNA maturation factor|nr:rRNA maturation RNase YbeY [Steroidobacteraceae bacterium]
MSAAATGVRARTTVSVRQQVRSRSLPPARRLALWASAALGARARGGEVSVLLVGPAASRALNARYRRRDRPTNVLSFPATGAARSAGLLGDLVICPAVLRAEAYSQGKSLSAHWAHLVVHGVLHLVGFDHEHAAEERRMQRREIRVLRGLGFDNPYRAR